MSEIKTKNTTSKGKIGMIDHFLQEKKSVHWVGGRPYASETYYCVTDNLEVIGSTLKEQAYKYLKNDENIVIMNVSTFNKLQKMLRSKPMRSEETRKRDKWLNIYDYGNAYIKGTDLYQNPLKATNKGYTR